MISFGELDISPLTVAVMVVTTLSIFLAVGLSTMSLVGSAVSKTDEKDMTS